MSPVGCVKANAPVGTNCPVREALESCVTGVRDKAAALTFVRKALKRHVSPERITTDGPRTCRAAMIELDCEDKQEIGRWANNRVKEGHQKSA